MYYYVFTTDKAYAFDCYSDLMGFDYEIALQNPQDLSKAMEIAEQELTCFCVPEVADDPEYYYQAGYIEVVTDKLEEQGIQVHHYTDLTEEVFAYD